MTVYQKDKNSNIWHWNLKCSQLPAMKNSIVTFAKPARGKFCTECIRLGYSEPFCHLRGKKEKQKIRVVQKY
ncbi:MAG: hypothetical protein H8E57_06245 [Candidatus Cloacimonetes bacterium]|nr:hypothetical protein [Candidatus Cloacimonadota bacterium]